MHPNHLKYLRCPKTGQTLCLQDECLENDKVKSGTLTSPSGETYPIVDFIPRFVDSDNYSENFGFEWKLHSRTQYDDDAGHKMSEERIFEVSGWERDLSGQVLLEAGSGSGRFTEHLLKTGAMVVSFDYSQAVEPNYASNGQHPNLLLVQGNIYEMPFEKAFFDKVFCFGVLQHTPDPETSFKSLVRMMKPGAKLATDIYLKTIKRYYLNTRYWVRPFTRNMESKKLYDRCVAYINFMWPLAKLIRRIPKIGEALNWRLLIADYSKQMPHADDATLKEWAYLDTFDMLSPAFDIPQSPKTYTRWHEEEGLKDVNVRLGPNGVVASAKSPE
ncbi:methyltransferase domain-containing protein [uncultured Kiloniella sp.]|uniref:class I SAM-dependent methyltransferase n=1 Tax=uncultured Kiloniella sp. TaxID=1133091 RepID=UPI00262762FC|nr:methyltransferase domain-containing protein [uncultured Kiloniella sp.]